MILRDRFSKPRILYAARWIPYVPSTGGITRSFHLVNAALKVANVSLVGVIPPNRWSRVRMLPDDCKIYGLKPSLESSLNRSAMADWIRQLETHEPRMQLPSLSGRSGKFHATVSRVLNQEEFDLVVVEHANIAALVQDAVEAWGGPRIVDLHNVLHVFAERVQMTRARTDGTPFPLATLRQLKEIERSILRSYSRVTAVSELDSIRLRKLDPDVLIDVVPNGVDIPYFETNVRQQTAIPGQEIPNVIFTGYLSYGPNLDAVSYFVDEIWPIIKASRPGVRLKLVGAGPAPASIEALRRDQSIEVSTSVEDIRPFFSTSRVAVVPLRQGTGTRLKILEALVSGLPVVSTSIGAEGLDLEPNRHILIRDTPEDFAAAVLNLLECPKLAAQIASDGANRVRQLYSWQDIAVEFQRVLLQSLSPREKLTNASP